MNNIRYFDSNNITGPLDIGQIFAQDANQSSTPHLRVLSLMNNEIADVTYTSEHINDKAFIIM